MSVAQVSRQVNRKKIDQLESKGNDILQTLVDGQVLRFYADKGTGKVEVEIVGETKPLTGPSTTSSGHGSAQVQPK